MIARRELLRFGAALTAVVWLAGATPAGGELEALSWSVEPGTTAVLVEDHRVPLVGLSIEFPAGAWSPWFRQAHAEEAFEIQNHDPAGRLRARADRLAVDLELEVGDRASTLRASCLEKDLEAMLSLVGDVLANESFDRAELKRWKQERRIYWKGARKQPFFRVGQEVARLLFAEGDPRLRTWEKPEPLETSPARLTQARDTLIRLPGRVIGFAGDLTLDAARRAAASLLPAVLEAPPAGIEPDLLPLRPASARPEVAQVALPRLTQAYLAFCRDSPDYADPDDPAFLVAGHVLGGHFYSRISVALRHEGGQTYGAWATSEGDVVPGPFTVMTFTRSDNLGAAERTLEATLEQFHGTGITEDERAAAVGYLRGQRLFRLQSPGRVLATFLAERRLGLPPGFYDQRVERAARLELGEINRFIRGYFAPLDLSRIRVVGD